MKCIALISWIWACAQAQAQNLETFPDGSAGRVTDFPAADHSRVPAYLRTPKGAGPFPVVVILHGGAPDPKTTYELGRRTTPPTANFVAAGWAVMVLDFHPNPTQPTSDRVDALSALEFIRHLPSIDAKRIALFGGSHGAGVISRIISQTDLHTDVRCAVMCAPAVIDLYEISKVVAQGVEVAGVLKKMVAAAPQKYGAPLEEVERNPAKYGYESSILEAPQVRCPVMIINGQNDTSAPIAVSQVYADRLKSAGKEVEIYFPENGKHGFYFGFPEMTPETAEAARRAAIFIRNHFQ